MQLDRTERRILGSLIEKRWSTPDQYPLSLNALVAACNQKSNRDPVLALQEFEVTGCLLGLREKGLVLIRDRDGGRVVRYAEKLSEELTLEPVATAILAELLLRGPQTVPELARRVKRMVPVDGIGPIEEALVDLARARRVVLMARESGKRHARWAHLLSAEEPGGAAGDEEPEVPQTGASPAAEPTPVTPTQVPLPFVPEPAVTEPAMTEPAEDPGPDLRTEVDDLRREVADLRERLERLESVVL